MLQRLRLVSQVAGLPRILQQEGQDLSRTGSTGRTLDQDPRSWRPVSPRV